MPISDHLRRLRARIGNDLLVMPAAAVMAFDGHGRLLLVRDAGSGLWAAPGGALDPDEDPADAAVREAFEETGLSMALQRVLGVYGGPDFRLTYPNGDVVSYCTIAFMAEVTGGEPRPDGIETTALGWFGEAEAAGLATGASTRRMVADAFARPTEARFRTPTWRPPSR
jgi:ADP-ribose pyrophosphatase YjhB (NUDIX family)